MSQVRRASLVSVTTPKRNRRRNRGATWLTVVSVISCVAVAVGLYYQLSAESGYGPWQDRGSTLKTGLKMAGPSSAAHRKARPTASGT